MLKLLLKIVAAIALIAMSVWAFIHLLPWVIAILAMAALAIKLYHAWLRRNGGIPPLFSGKEP